MPSRSTTVSLLVIFVAYTIASYGVVLLRGYDVPWKQWIDPLDPYQWPANVPHIPPTQIFPSPAASAAAAGAAGAAAGAAIG